MALNLSNEAFALSQFETSHKLPAECRPMVQRINTIAKDQGLRLSREFVALVIRLCDSSQRLSLSLKRVGLHLDLSNSAFARILGLFSQTCEAAIGQWVAAGGKPPTKKRVSTTSSRDEPYKNLAKERDGEKCILTRMGEYPEVANIFAYSLSSSRRDLSEKLDLWTFLRCYLAPSDYQELKDYLLKDPSNNVKTNINRLENVITLDHSVHPAFSNGLIGFELVEGSETKSSYRLRLRKLATRSETDDFSCEKLHASIPSSYGGLNSIKDDIHLKGVVLVDARSGEQEFIRDGFEFLVSTPDPDRLPLPSLILLKLHLAISQIIRLSGAGSVPEDVDFDDDDNEADQLFEEEEDGSDIGVAQSGKKTSELEHWMATLPQELSQFKSSNNHSETLPIVPAKVSGVS